jgi:hypothetical protein
MRSHSQRIRSIALPMAAIALLAAACSKSSAQTGGSPTPQARPSSTGHIQILSPKNGQVFHGSSVDIPVKVVLTGAKIVPATTTHVVPDQGHIHVYLDNQIATMNFSLTGDVPNVGPGLHVLKVEFVASDHQPFDPRVIEQVAIEVKA